MKDLQKNLRVALVQATPVMFDKDATIEKVCGQIREAGENGAELARQRKRLAKAEEALKSAPERPAKPETQAETIPRPPTFKKSSDPCLWTNCTVRLTA